MTRTVLLALDTSTEFCSVALLLADSDSLPTAATVSNLAVSNTVVEAGTVADPNAVAVQSAAEARSTAKTSSTVAAPTGVVVPNAVVVPNSIAAPNSIPAPNVVAPQYVNASIQVWFRHEATGPVSSTRLLPAIRQLFEDAGLALADCTAIAFGAGPGSFTGLRTATGVAQGLAFGLGVPVVPVGTLLACAEFARLREPSLTRVLTALDARMDEVYWADFEFNPAAGDWRTIRPAALDAPDALVLPDAPFTLAGNGAAAFGERLPAVAAAARVDHEALPHALPVALAGLRALRAGRTVPPALAAPEYVRDKVAQTTAERMEARAAKDARGKEKEPVR